MEPSVQVALVEAGADAVRGLFWFAVIGLVLYRFREVISATASRVKSFNLKMPFLEFSVALRASAALAAAQVTRGKATSEFDTEISEVAEDVARASASRKRSRALWVDDHPENNHYELFILDEAGVEVETVTSTDAAVTRIGQRSYDLLITDLQRGDDQYAGISFIKKARALSPDIPIIVYSSEHGQGQYPEARRCGASATEFEPTRFIRAVLRLL